jgi:hypothetical protein
MNHEAAIRKVLACLHMAESSNPHEAACALRQARAMMEKYGLNNDAILAAQIHVVEAKTRHAGAVPPQSICALANLIADGFRCHIIIHRVQAFDGRGKTSIVFHGAGADARIAAYAFDVLRRQMASDRLKHIRRVRKRANRERRGEEFALGWINGIYHLFPKAELPDGRERALLASMKAHHGDCDTVSARDLTTRGRANDSDQFAGYNAGRIAKLHAGLDGEQQRQLKLGVKP